MIDGTDRKISVLLVVVVVGLVLSVLIGVGRADQLDKPVTQGSIHARIQVLAVGPDEQLTQSVSLVREDNGVRILCLPAANETIAEGDTDPVSRADAGVLLRSYAHAGPDCTGDVSLASTDAYRVIFGNPGRPVLVRVN